MIKLLNTYRADPSDKNAIRLAAYQTKHPMASCFLTTDDFLDLKEALEKAKKVLVSLQKK
jgi:hypothetical protein